MVIQLQASCEQEMGFRKETRQRTRSVFQPAQSVLSERRTKADGTIAKKERFTVTCFADFGRKGWRMFDGCAGRIYDAMGR